MRKIKNRTEIEKSQRKTKILVGIVLIGLMFVSTVGYAFFSGGDSSNTNHEANQSGQGDYIGGKWVYHIGDKQFAFTNYVGLAANVPVDFNISLGDYQTSPVFIVSDNNLISSEIFQNLNGYFPRIQEACYGHCDKDLPEKKCNENLIVYKESNESRVYQKENCVFIEGDLVAVDAFLYKILGFI